ncbi:MAG: phosphatidylinositol kinase [Bacteroidetes bacterium 4572_112]|nr:MAG: phosphatidylinositol kinase [Bacteroidetes bacterium 4572_112]
MRQVKVLFKNEEAGILTQHDDGSFTFSYNDNWVTDSTKKAISLSLPKTKKEHYSKILFPFFYNMLPEGSNKQIVCKQHRIDKDDSFGLLIITAKEDNIGAINVQKI